MQIVKLAETVAGNPGVAQYYADFMEELHSHCHLPVCCVSHAGHVTSPQLDFPYSKKDRTYMSLDGQIQHKLAYVSDYIPAGKSLILIGHSIGCYMIIKMLASDTSNSLMNSSGSHSVRKCYFLFPTIERLAQTPNGQFFTPILKYFWWSVPLLTYFLTFVPYRCKRFLVEWHFGVGQVSQCALEATVKLLSPTCCGNSCYLANFEMQSVCKPDIETIGKNLERFCFYYGMKDAWCPVEFCHTMTKLFPTGDIHLCARGIEHAFVLKDSKLMASIVADWVRGLAA